MHNLTCILLVQIKEGGGSKTAKNFADADVICVSPQRGTEEEAPATVSAS